MLISILLLLLLLLILLKDMNESFKNFENINKNIFNKIKTLELDEKNIDIDKILPKNIKLKKFKDKGWGLISLKNIKKNDTIYKVPIKYYSDKFSPTLFSKKKDCVRKMSRDKHSFKNTYNNRYIFGYWDSFLNHNINYNAYYGDKIINTNGNYFVVLKANTNIKKGDEILVNYFDIEKNL